MLKQKTFKESFSKLRQLLEKGEYDEAKTMLDELIEDTKRTLRHNYILIVVMKGPVVEKSQALSFYCRKRGEKMSFQYDQYLERHRSNVKRGFDWLFENLPEITKEATNAGWNAEFAHDKSKDEPDEYEPYDAYFYGITVHTGRSRLSESMVTSYSQESASLAALDFNQRRSERG